MVDPWFRFLKCEFAGSNRLKDVGTGTAATIRIWVPVKKRSTQRLSEAFFFGTG
jgi:hypothetical protein